MQKESGTGQTFARGNGAESGLVFIGAQSGGTTRTSASGVHVPVDTAQSGNAKAVNLKSVAITQQNRIANMIRYDFMNMIARQNSESTASNSQQVL